VLPTAYGSNGVVSNVTGGVIINHGQVVAGYGGPVGVAGGIGVDLTARGMLTNTGLVAGGGAYNANGGVGLNIAAGAAISNSGTVEGGANATARYGGSGLGGDAVLGVMSHSAKVGVTLTNSGTCIGGAGATHGGNGINLMSYPYSGLADTVFNSGVVAGGAGADGGNGVVLAGQGTLTNQGAVRGGYGGGSGVLLTGYTILANQANIQGGVGAYTGGNRYAGLGGTGVSIKGQGASSNQGTISGGAGGQSTTGYGGYGGVGVYITGGANFTNTGVVEGGAAGNSGSNLYIFYHEPHGGGGAILSGGAFANSGMIAGGLGGTGVLAGNGGGGLELSAGTLVNTGLIQGGDGGASQTSFRGVGGIGGAGGVGVYLTSGTLTNAGTISGGAGGYGIIKDGAAGDAVQFNFQPATLVVDPGAVFIGQVTAQPLAKDTLILAAGPAAGTLSGLGTQFTGFAAVSETAQATWSLLGTSTIGSGSILDAGGQLTFIGAAEGSGHVRIDRGATVTAGSTLAVAAVVFGAAGGAHLILDAPTFVTNTLSGFGAKDTIDLIKLAANSESFANGTLTLLENGSVVDTLTVAGKYTSGNFSLKSDGHGGTTIGFVAGANGIGTEKFDAWSTELHGGHIPAGWSL
jgi:hypothetical protein